jgi:two-component system, OmpR family, sensor histidine kinase VicK
LNVRPPHTTNNSNSTIPTERSEVLYGTENAKNLLLQIASQAKRRIDVCDDYTIPSVNIPAELFKRLLSQAKSGQIRFRYLTEITKGNIEYCKQIMEIAEVRHLYGIKANFGVSDTEYTSTAVMQQVHAIPEVIYSNVEKIVEQQQYLFETLWSKAISAEQRIREIEEGIIPYETRIIENNPDDIVKQIKRLSQNSNELATCLTSGGMQYSYNYFFDVKKKLLDKQKRGEHKGIRYISNIDKDNIQLVKKYLESGIQVKHVRNLPPMSFGVSDKEIAATIEKMEGGKRVESLLVSNEPAYVKHFSSIFEELWKNGIDAADRIRDIGEGIDLADIEIIQNPKEGIARAWNIIKSAREEISIMFSSANVLLRQVDMGALQLLKNISEVRGAKVRLLIPSYSDEPTLSTILEELKSQCPLVDVRSMDKTLQTKITIVLSDRKECIIIELKDDTKDSSYSAAGLSTYSNSKSIVSSYVSIFESIWKQTELYEQLKVHDKMQKEFINVAAHELRTPIQPILGLSEVLQSKIKDNEQRALVDVISRNAKRLQRLTEDILDVTRIESQSLSLKKETFNLNEIIMSILAEYGSRTGSKNNVKITFASKDDFTVQGDIGRLGQVLSNFIDNATKFTQEGNIDISVEKMQNDNVVVLSVRDTGSGIDPDIMPRLFTKFTTMSSVGTGLGLYISKNIVEAHGGRIWAENNSNGKGATFSFSLPIFKT